jgi:cation:H+ antiporter
MAVWLSAVLFIIGFAVIVKGGDFFVGSAVWFAEVTGLPRLLIGATIVSLATMLPEYFVSVLAVAGGAYDFGASNAMGSIICNTGLILSLSLIAAPFAVENKLFYTKVFLMFASLLCLFILLSDSRLTVWESIPFFILFGYFVYINVKYVATGGFRRQVPAEMKKERSGRNVLKHIFLFILGAAGIVVGARLLVDNGIRIAHALNVPESIVSVTLVAFGTALPELVTTLSAIARRETSMGIGNVLGANILNLTLLIGSCTLVSGGGLHIHPEYLKTLGQIIPRPLYIDIPFIGLLFLVLLLPPLLFKNRMFKFQGVLMLVLYMLFVIFLIFNV